MCLKKLTLATMEDEMKFEVFYDGNGYKSSTVIEADSKEAAMKEVQETYSGCVKATHAIGPVNYAFFCAGYVSTLKP